MPKTNAGKSINEGAEDFSLRELAAPLFRRKRLLLITLLVVFVGITPIGLLLFYKFRSQMAIFVNRERIDSLVTAGASNQTITQPLAVAEEEINSEAELLLSQDVLEKVVLANNLQAHKASLLDIFQPKRDEAYDVAQAVKTLARKIKVKPSTKADIINVSYSSNDPKLSYAVLNSLSTLYLEKHAEVHRPAGSYEFFSGETERYKKALAESEARLRDFVQTPGSVAPDLQRTDLDLQLANFIGKVHATEEAIAADQKRIQSDQEQMKMTPQRSTTQLASSPADLLLQQLGASLLAAETKRSQLLLKYDPSYPLVQEADRELAETKAAFEKAEQTKYVTEDSNVDPTYELLREDLAKSQADLAAQQASLAANKASVANMQSQMVQLAEKGLDQSDLVREQKANEENYLLYLSKREQERTSDALDKTRIENVAIATPPSIPVLPVLSPFAVILLAFAGAVFVSITTAYAVDYFDSSFHTPAEIVDILGIPVVVSISKRTA
ncbi:GumC family protein [Acidicapsa acidisoli]|uniref:GumC family protein n=1 Tax=Acidicapsa acidisoli TaxID=1615681 RepID=UPI0021E068E6|nr:Wzz/FepE/Etk N-terminal domain-containing protein [Acidicapsa acidisoli]